MKKTNTVTNVKTYSGKELAGYLTGLAGQNMIYNIVSAGLMYYFQSVIFLPVMICSVIVAVARVWDAINDPMMGSIVDKTNTKWGKCKPYLLFVPGIIMVITLLCFLNGRCVYEAGTDGALILSGSTGVKNVLIIVWAGVSYILWGMAYTAGDIPLWGVTSLMTEDAKDRSKVLALARIVATAGVVGMLVQLGASMFDEFFKNKGVTEFAAQRQYSVMLLALILTVFASILFQFAGFSVKEKVQQRTDEHHTMKENFQTMWNCKPFRQLLISGVLRSPIQLLTTVAITLVMYFFFDNDAGKALSTDTGLNVALILKVLVIAVGIFGGMLAASAVTPVLARKFEKKSLYNFYSVIGALPFGIVFIIYKLGGENIVSSYPWAIATGVIFFAASWSQGGLNVLQSIMIADCVDYEEYHNAVRPDGVFFAGQSFITKLSAGIATIISGIVFHFVGWSGGNIDAVNTALSEGAHFAADYPQYAASMFFLVSIPPMVGMILSAIPTLKYALSNDEHKRILAELVDKRRASEK